MVTSQSPTAVFWTPLGTPFWAPLGAPIRNSAPNQPATPHHHGEPRPRPKPDNPLQEP
jgi:hypothetical protein